MTVHVQLLKCVELTFTDNSFNYHFIPYISYMPFTCIIIKTFKEVPTKLLGTGFTSFPLPVGFKLIVPPLK